MHGTPATGSWGDAAWRVRTRGTCARSNRMICRRPCLRERTVTWLRTCSRSNLLAFSHVTVTRQNASEKPMGTSYRTSNVEAG